MTKNISLLQALDKATIYEVNIRQYTKEGSIEAFRQHLPRLKKMGVDIIWLMPMHPIGKTNRKGSLGSYYSISDFADINPEFGTKLDFKKLVDEIHALEMKVIMDWVANHAAWDNIWTINHPDFFSRNEDGEFLSPYDWTDVIQINHENEHAHDKLREAMCYWVNEFDIDGFRADLAHLTPVHFWVKARMLTESIKPNLIWLAESDDVHYAAAFDVFFSWKWMHQTEHFFKNHLSISELIQVLYQQNDPFPPHVKQLYFTSNHDENSWNGTEFEKYGIYAKALTVFSFFFPNGVPLIYSGQEVANNKRLHFFDKDVIDWNSETNLIDFYQRLSFTRKQLMVNDTLEFIPFEEKILAFKRGEDSACVYVFLNVDYKPVNINHQLLEGVYVDILDENQTLYKSYLSIPLDPGDFVVLIPA
jgi:glycosidase